MKLSTLGTSFFHAINFYRNDAVKRSLRAMRDGLLWLVPCLIVSSILGFTASMLEFLHIDAPVFIQELSSLRNSLNSLYPALFACSISIMLAIQWRLPRPPVAALCVAYVAIAEGVLGYHDSSTQTLLTFVGLTMPLYVVPLLYKLKKQSWARLVEHDMAGNLLKDSMNLIIPGITAMLVVVLVTKLIKVTTMQFDIAQVGIALDPESDPFAFGTIFTLLNSSFWFLGIHGYYALTPLVEPLIQALDANRIAVEADLIPTSIMNMSTLSSFVFIGGSGATLGLSLAILLFSQDKLMRAIALASIPLGMLNINEILMFGLPIIFNLRLLFPFIAAPLINMVIALTVLKLGFVAIPFVMTPITSPVILNALVGSGGDISAVVLQITLIALNIILYAPFVCLFDKHSKTRDLYIPSLDTTFTRRAEEAYMLPEDPVTDSLGKAREIEGVHKKLEEYATKEFYLEYQPQVSPESNQVVGAEALMRLRDSAGNVESPGSFLAVFEKAHLMADIDIWVVRQAVIQSQKWMDEAFYMPLCVNITAQTLTNERAMEQIIKQVKKVPGLINFEITEESLIHNTSMLAQTIARLHEAGSLVQIDDFGTGYSSLSYLNRFDIDTIKIDRSFVEALDSERGMQVFHSLTGIAKQLGMNTIVEGVETQNQLDIAKEDPGVVIQGWYYSKALSADALRLYVDARRKAQTHNVETVLA